MNKKLQIKWIYINLTLTIITLNRNDLDTQTKRVQSE